MANARAIIVQERLRHIQLREEALRKPVRPLDSLEDVDKLKEWVKDAIHPPKTKPGKKPKKFRSAAKVLGLDENEEGIRAAAVRTSDGTVYEAPAHFGAVSMARRDGKTIYDEDENLGFVTTTGRFVNRAEAELIGLRRGQLRPDIQEPGITHAGDFDHYL